MSVTGNPTIVIEANEEEETYSVDFNRVGLEFAYNIFKDIVHRFEDGSLLKDEPEVSILTRDEVDTEDEVQ